MVPTFVKMLFGFVARGAVDCRRLARVELTYIFLENHANANANAKHNNHKSNQSYQTIRPANELIFPQ